jgi:hypothetical protein
VDVDEVLAHRGGSFRAPLDGSEFAGASIDPRSQPNSNGSKWWRRGNWDGRPLPTCSSLSLAVLTEGKSLGEVSQGWVGPALSVRGPVSFFCRFVRRNPQPLQIRVCEQARGQRPRISTWLQSVRHHLIACSSERGDPPTVQTTVRFLLTITVINSKARERESSAVPCREHVKAAFLHW